MAKSYLNQNNLPRGLRNNNPGNLIFTDLPWNGKVEFTQNKDWTGTPSNIVRKFEQFIELRYGIRALMRDVFNDFRKGKTTVTALITEFAPAFENNTSNYITSVVNSIGGNVIGELTETKLIAICKAIILVENGSGYTSYITDTDYKEALAISGLSLKKKITQRL